MAIRMYGEAQALPLPLTVPAMEMCIRDRNRAKRMQPLWMVVRNTLRHRMLPGQRPRYRTCLLYTSLRSGQCAVVGNALRSLVELVLFLQCINVGLVDVLDGVEHRVGGILETGLRKLVVDVTVCNADTLMKS